MSPATAAEQVARAIMAAAPRGRELFVLSIARGEAPGLCVAPWTEVGVARAHEHAPAQVVRLTAGETWRSHGDPVGLSWPAVARPLRIPSSWLGRRLCLVTPCVVASDERRMLSGHGPVAAAFEALALALGAPTTGDPAGLGARIAAHVFAHVAVIVDASWSTIFTRGLEDGGPSFTRSPTARCVGFQAPCPTADGHALRVEDIDAWIVRRLGIAGPVSMHPLAVHGDTGDPRWLPAAASIGALADREVAALWRGASAPSLTRAPRGARRPADPLDRAWEVWTERSS